MILPDTYNLFVITVNVIANILTLFALYLCIGFDPFINQLLYCGVLWLFQGMYFVLFGMKVALHFQKMSEAKAKIARLEDALLKVSKDALPSR
ncbi:hypothetical protein BDR26DRAFT_857793 [Obelidium mucronatum]|nr:hypothetical protein BDR26DRAFT_857793 [Obelidium mucronatum]